MAKTTKYIPVVNMTVSCDPKHEARSYICMMPAYLWDIIDDAEKLYEECEGILLAYDGNGEFGWMVVNHEFSTSDPRHIETFGEDFDAAQARILELGNEYGVVHNAKELH